MNDFNKLHFNKLPGFAAFILHECLEEYTRMLLKFSVEEEVPILRLFSHLSDDEMLEISLQPTAELLQVFIDNRTAEFLEQSLKVYVDDQMPDIDREDILVKDITLGNLVRRKVFRKFIKRYTSDIELTDEIMDEIDTFIAVSEGETFKVFLQIQQEKITKINSELSHGKEELLELQELANMGSFEWNAAEGYTNLTPGIFKILGINNDNANVLFWNSIHPEDIERLNNSLDDAIHNDGIFECEYHYCLAGVEKYIWSRGKIIYQNGKRQSMKGNVMDVTDKHNLDLALIKSSSTLQNLNASLATKNSDLEQINQELESFNYVASHDLQEPLRKIQMFTGRILEKGKDCLTAEMGTYFEKIIASSSRMRLLIDDLLKFSRTSIFEQDFDTIDLNDVVAEVFSGMSQYIDEVEMEFEVAELPKINGISFQINQLFDNLLNNSIKYARKDGRPKVTVKSQLLTENQLNLGANISGSYYEISFTDNGIGFQTENSEKIFDLFQRLHGRQDYSGTGIGLAICKKIVYNHKGFIKAEGKLGEGSVFKIYFPAN